MINIFTNIILGIPDESRYDWRLYLLRKTFLGDCYGFCINRDCFSFDRIDFDENLVQRYQTVIYFNDVCTFSTKDNLIWYNKCSSLDFIDLFRNNKTILYGIALNIIDEIDLLTMENKLNSTEWKACLAPPHIVYAKDAAKKFIAFNNYIAPKFPIEPITLMAEFTTYARYMPPLLIRLTVEQYFISRPSLNTSTEEREAVARLEIRTQSKLIRNVIGATIRLNKTAMIIPKIYKHIKLIQIIFSYLLKMVGSSTNIELNYNRIRQECIDLNFDLFAAAHMYLLAFPEMRNVRQEWYTSVISKDIEFGDELSPEEFELTDRFCILLQLVRGKKTMDHEA